MLCIDITTLQQIITIASVLILLGTLILAIFTYNLSKRIFHFERKTLLSTTFIATKDSTSLVIKNDGSNPVKKIEVDFLLKITEPDILEKSLGSWLIETDLNPSEKIVIPLFDKVVAILQDLELMSIRSTPAGYFEDPITGEYHEYYEDVNYLKKEVSLSLNAYFKYLSDIPKAKPFEIMKRFKMNFNFKDWEGYPLEYEENYTVNSWTEMGGWKD